MASSQIASPDCHFQLRYLQTLNSISAENNSTVIFPVPVDIINTAMSNMAASAGPALPPFLPPGPLPHNLQHRAGIPPANVKVRAIRRLLLNGSANKCFHKNLLGH